MLLPYSTNEIYSDPQEKPQPPYLTVGLMLVMVVIAVWMELAGRGAGRYRPDQIIATLGLVPATVAPFALFTYPFVHAGYGHLLLNLFYLFVFGSGVEAAVERVKMLGLFLVGGAVGGAIQVAVTRAVIPEQAHLPIVGSSAACAALIGLYSVRYYRARLKFVGIPFKPQVVGVVLFILVCEMASGIYSIIGGDQRDGIAHWAHLGGFTFGLGCAYLLRLDVIGQWAYLQRDAAKDMQYSVPGEAIKRWQTVLNREPNNGTAHAEIAKAWSLLGDTEQAEPHFLKAIDLALQSGRRSDAALLLVEMREQGVRTLPPANQLFLLGNTLEELEQHALAADTLRAVTIHNPDAPEAETALLKVAQLYLNHLHRRDEAAILLRLFKERYAHSPLCRLADEMQRSL